MKSRTSMRKDIDDKILILLENEEHVKDCISWINEIKGEKLIVALTPFAIYELDKHGYNYKIPEDYYSSDELYQIGFGNFKKVEDLCDLIDIKIQENCSDFTELNIKPSMFSFYHLKIIYDAMTIRVFQLSKIIDTEKPCDVYFYDSAKYPFGAYESASYLLFNQMESLYSQLLLLGEWNVGLKLLPHLPRCRSKTSKINNKTIFAKFKKCLSIWLIGHPELYDFVFTIKKIGFSGSIHWLKKYLYRTKYSSVLLYGAGYNWDDCNEDLRAEGIAPLYRISDDFHWLDQATKQDLDSLHIAWIRLQENSEFMNFFIFHNIDFFPLVKERFEFLVKQMSIACLIAVQDVTNLIDTKNIRAVIASTFSTCVSHSTAQAAHNSKIPVITWQHGGYGAMEIHPLVNYCDLINSDMHFVFGDGVIDSYLQAAKKYETELIVVDSPLLECINYRDTITRDDTSNNGQNILYVTSSYLQNSFNISTLPAISDITFWKIQKSIIDILGQHDNHSITIKLHPSNSGTHPLQSYSVDQKYGHFKFIQREKSFTELLQTADIIVIDLPFTTILQALNTNKPIFVYTGCVHYNQNAYRLLSKRAICCINLNDFLCKLDKYLTDNVYEADFSNTDFLEMYGMGSKDSTSKKKAPKELKQIINTFN